VLTSERLKEVARGCGADIVGVAPIERFENAPPEAHPASMWPDVKSVVVFGLRIPRGAMRGIEEGTHWPSYHFFGYGGLGRFIAEVSQEIQHFIEDNEWEAVPMTAAATLLESRAARKAIRPDRPPPNAIPSFRLAAVAAGLGEMGYSKVLLTPQFGPRQRLGMVYTDAPLEPDPLFEGSICDRCMRCVADCPAGAINGDRTVTTSVDGKDLEWNDLDLGKCKLTHTGYNRAASPFVIKDMPGLRLDISKQTMSWQEAWDFARTLSPAIRYTALIDIIYGQHRPICGARGCIRACVDHLETTGRIAAQFHNPFRRRPAWLLE
jgi:epoxyqueuosine reductase